MLQESMSPSSNDKLFAGLSDSHLDDVNRHITNTPKVIPMSLEIVILLLLLMANFSLEDILTMMTLRKRRAEWSGVESGLTLLKAMKKLCRILIPQSPQPYRLMGGRKMETGS